MITVLIQHRLRCKVATVELYRHLFHNICIWQGAYTAPLLPSPPPLLHPQKMTSSKQWESKPGLAHILLHAAQRFYLCVDYYLLWASQHICVPPLISSLVFPFLAFPFLIPPLSVFGLEKTLSPTLPVQTLRKPLQRVWAEMIYGKWVSDRRLFLSFLVPWTLSGKLCLLTQI